jgi:hypothetical protein
VAHAQSRRLDRFLLGFWSLFLTPRRIRRAAVILQPLTVLRFHRLLKQRKNQQLYSANRKGKPGPRGTSHELIQSVVELKCRNNRIGCPRSAQQINKTFGNNIDKDMRFLKLSNFEDLLSRAGRSPMFV